MQEYTCNNEEIMRADIRNLVDAALDNDVGEIWTASLSGEEKEDETQIQAAALWFKPGSGYLDK